MWQSIRHFNKLGKKKYSRLKAVESVFRFHWWCCV